MDVDERKGLSCEPHNWKNMTNICELFGEAVDK
jgi:hypothetical protein